MTQAEGKKRNLCLQPSSLSLSSGSQCWIHCNASRFFSMKVFKTIGGIQKDIKCGQLWVCGSIYEYFKERAVTFCAETHSCNVCSSSGKGETKMGLGSSKLSISECVFSLISLGKPLGLLIIEISLIFKSFCFSLFHKCESRGCSFLCWFLNTVISKSVLIYSYENASMLKVKCNPIKNDTGFANGEK